MKVFVCFPCVGARESAAVPRVAGLFDVGRAVGGSSVARDSGLAAAWAVPASARLLLVRKGTGSDAV